MKLFPQALPGVESVAEDFYRSPEGLYMPNYVRSAHSEYGLQSVSEGQTGPLHVPEWVHDEQQLKEFFGTVGGNLNEINNSLKVIKQDGDSFEMAIIWSKREEGAKKGVMLHISTYSSSISTNLGNAYEFAVQAALYEDFDHVYVASPGNGGSSAIKNGDELITAPWGKMGQRDYFCKTGRTTYEDGNEVKPLPYLVNMQKALATQGIHVTGFIGADSAGGSYATGLALAMPEGQVNRGFFSERSNFTQLGRAGLSFGMLFTENVRNGNRMRQLGDGRNIDPLSIYSSRLDDPKHEKDNKSMAVERMTRASDIPQISNKEKLGAMVTSLTALARGPHNTGFDPLVQDVNAMLKRHPAAKFTFTLAEKDVLYAGEARRLATEFLAKIAIQKADAVAIILEKLPHAYHTSLPLLQDALRREAFGIAI